MIFTAIGGIVAGSLFGLAAGTAAFALVSGVVGGALAFGAQYLLNSYLGRQKKRTYSAVQGQREYGARVPVWTLYGTGKVSGHHIYYAKWGHGNRYNGDVFILANGWCDGLEPEIFFYGEKHELVSRTITGNEVAHYGVAGFDNLISIRFYDGRPGQGPDTKLVSDTASLGQSWKSTSVCSGMAYVVVERDWSEVKFDKGQPEFEFVIRGLRLYNPQKDSTVSGGSGTHRIDDPETWEFSENPALQRLNYQLGLRGLRSGRTLIGEGKTIGQLDLSSYFAAINACDALREGRATYRASLLVTSDDDHTEVLKEFDDAMAGYGLNRRGLSGVIAGTPQIPVCEIGPDDIDLNRPKSIKRRKSAFELYNHMAGQFTSREANWNPQSLAPITVNADVLADGRVRQVANDFLQVTDPDIAEYLLQIRYRQNRRGGTATIPVSRRIGFSAYEGEWVIYDGLTWLVTNWSLNDKLEVTLTLAETDDDIYSSGGIIPGPIVVPPPPQVNPSVLFTVENFEVDVGMIAGEDGYEQPVLRFSWTPPEDPTIVRVRFQYQVENSTQTPFEDASDYPEAGVFFTSKNVMSGKHYVARATITTVPDRFKTWTEWKTTTFATGRAKVTAILESFGKDARAVLERIIAQVNENTADIERMALAGAEEGGTVTELNAATRRLGNATAGAFQEMAASIQPGFNGSMRSSASLVGGALAKVGDISAEGLRSIVVTAGEGDVVARLTDMVRASVASEAVTAGVVVEAGFKDGDPLQPFSNYWLIANKVGVLNPLDASSTALFAIDEGGVIINTLLVRGLTADSIDTQSLAADEAFVTTLTAQTGFFDHLTLNDGNIPAGIITTSLTTSGSGPSVYLLNSYVTLTSGVINSFTGLPIVIFCSGSGSFEAVTFASESSAATLSASLHLMVNGSPQLQFASASNSTFNTTIATGVSGSTVTFYKPPAPGDSTLGVAVRVTGSRLNSSAASGSATGTIIATCNRH